jgi:hypothetical protein
MAVTLRTLVLFGAASFVLGALLHADLRIPVGFVVLDEPRIGPAAVVEGLSGLSFAVAAVAVFARRPSAWRATAGAHLFGLAGVVLGTWAIAAGRGPESTLNDAFHRVMLLLLPVGLVLLLTSAARAALGADPIVREGIEP